MSEPGQPPAAPAVGPPAAPTAAPTAGVSFRAVTKRFGAIVANDAVTFDVQAGSIHALLGENGAGKTTLLSILAGLQKADSGSIRVAGHPLPQGSPSASLRAGVGLCAQHFLLAGALTGAENILLGRPGARGWRPLAREKVRALERLASEHGLATPLDVPVEHLSIGEQERIEILKLLERDARVLVLDEPTSVLAPPEIAPLFDTLRKLAAGGRTVVLVTHRLREAMEIADRVTVLREGRVVGEGDPREIGGERLIEWIAGGRHVARTVVRARSRPAERGTAGGKAPAARELRLACRALSCGSGPNAPRRLDLEVHAGEIVGVGGVLGNGQSELVAALTGQTEIASGEVELLGRAWGAGERVRLPDEVAWIPEDRRAEGLALEMTLEENLAIGLPRGEGLHGKPALERLRAFDVRPADLEAGAGQLSGGNQQRLLLAREMGRRARLLLAVHPTRGLDPASTAFVQERLIEAREAGTGVLLVTADMRELLLLADRLLVLYRGTLRYAADAGDAQEEAVARAMVGAG